MIFFILRLYIYPFAPITGIRMNVMLDFMCMDFTELRELNGNRTCNLSHRKLTISLDHLVTLSDDKMCLKIL